MKSLWEFRVGQYRPFYDAILWYLRNCPGNLLKTYLRLGVVGHSPRYVTFRNSDGLIFDLDLSDFIQQAIYSYQYYEIEDVKALRKMVPFGGVFFDIGANVGQYSLLAANLVGPAGRVYSFEPGEIIFKRLKRNVDLNKFENISLINKAVGNLSGETEFYAAKGRNSGEGSLLRLSSGRGEIREQTSCRVGIVRLDDFCEKENIKRVNVLKIDAEGYENEIIKGAGNILNLNQDLLVMMEISRVCLKEAGLTPHELISNMEGFRFRGFKANMNGRLVPLSHHERIELCNVFFIR
ncbi:MAG: FkbM family methyltransferase [Deltaproteobacteria bacterium]|nr:FkbM family methyltransferase [Deltaproteobacteria bacterium]